MPKPRTNNFLRNPYLTQLTDGRTGFYWLVYMLTTTGVLLVISGYLIWGKVLASDPFFSPQAWFISLVGFPLAILVSVATLALAFVSAAKLTAISVQREQLEILQMANISPLRVFWSRVISSSYRIRLWLICFAGLCPYLLWLGCQSYNAFWSFLDGIDHYSLGDIRLYDTVFGGVMYRDGPNTFMRVMGLYWLFCITIGLIGFCGLLMISAVCVTWQPKQAIRSIGSGLAFVAWVGAAAILFLLPQGFLIADTSYEYVGQYGADGWGRVLWLGLIIALLPGVIYLIVRHIIHRTLLSV